MYQPLIRGFENSKDSLNMSDLMYSKMEIGICCKSDRAMVASDGIKANRGDLLGPRTFGTPV